MWSSRTATRVQTKLTLGQPGDRYEQEADSVARAIVQQQGQSRDVHSILRLQRTIGNQAKQRLLEANAVNTKGDAPSACSVPNGGGSGVRVAGTSVNAATCDEDTPVPEKRKSLEPCGDQFAGVMGISTHGQSRLNVSSVGDQFEQEADRVAKNECAASEGGQCNCPTCAEEALQAQNGPTPAPAPTFTFISRGSYGETTQDLRDLPALRRQRERAPWLPDLQLLSLPYFRTGRTGSGETMA